LSEQEHKQLLVELMSSEAITTSNIEGEVLNRDSVQFSTFKGVPYTRPQKAEEKHGSVG
jgi:hypothetical protein